MIRFPRPERPEGAALVARSAIREVEAVEWIRVCSEDVMHTSVHILALTNMDSLGLDWLDFRHPLHKNKLAEQTRGSYERGPEVGSKCMGNANQLHTHPSVALRASWVSWSSHSSAKLGPMAEQPIGQRILEHDSSPFRYTFGLVFTPVRGFASGVLWAAIRIENKGSPFVRACALTGTWQSVNGITDMAPMGYRALSSASFER